MGFRENLIRKVQINRLTEQVSLSIHSPERIDLPAIKTLLDMSDYRHHRERDLDLYIPAAGSRDKMDILVLDNELKWYHTTIDDVALRKSPTLKEMVSIRNAIKILNDTDVVVTRQNESVQRLRTELINALDLSFTAEDLQALEGDGGEALKNKYADGVIEILTLFSELLGLEEPPRQLQLPHHHIKGAVVKRDGVETRMNPMVLFSLMHMTLKMIKQPISTLDKSSLARLQQIGKGDAKADIEGPEVWTALKKWVLEKDARP
jgi:hypothetical protein